MNKVCGLCSNQVKSRWEKVDQEGLLSDSDWKVSLLEATRAPAEFKLNFWFLVFLKHR